MIALPNAPRNANDLSALARSCPGKTILITGATGFVGSHYLLWRLCGDVRFVAAVRGATEARARQRLHDALEQAAAAYNMPLEKDILDERVEVVTADITESNLGLASHALSRLERAKVDEVWHFASSLRFAERHRTEIETTNIDGCRHTIEFAARIGVRRFVYVSTAYTVGQACGDVAEILHPIEGPFNNVYEETKCIAEHNAVRLTAALGIELRVLRLAVVVGPIATHRTGGNNTGLYGWMREIYRLRTLMNEMGVAITLIGEPEIPINLVPVDQCVRDMLLLERHQFAGGPFYHLSAGEVQPLSAIIAAICGHLRVPQMKIEPVARGDRTPLEQILDRYTAFYGAYFKNPKRFLRSLPLVNGITRADVDAYALAQARALRHRPEERLFDAHTVRSVDRLPLCAYSAGREDAPAVVLANAYGMPVDFWQPMGKRLAERLRVITWESRFVPNTMGTFDEKACGASFHHRDMAQVMNNFDVARAHVVGWCSGAQVALDFARAFPDRVKSLVLINGTYCMDPKVPRTDFLRNFLSIAEKIAVDRRRAEFYCRMIFGGGGTGGDQKQLYSIMAGVDPFLLHLTSAPFRNPEALYRYANLFVEHFKGDELQPGSVAARTLVVAAKRDVVADHRASEVVAERISGARYIEIADGDHFSMYFNAGLADEVIEFLFEGEDSEGSMAAVSAAE